MADSFGSTPLIVTAPALDEDSPVTFSERVIPGGGGIYIDIAGASAPKLVLELYFPNPADYTAFKALRGTTATLTYVAGTPTALLVDVHRTKRNLSSTGQTWCTAEFRITS